MDKRILEFFSPAIQRSVNEWISSLAFLTSGNLFRVETNLFFNSWQGCDPELFSK